MDGSAYNKKYKSELFMITCLILERGKNYAEKEKCIIYAPCDSSSNACHVRKCLGSTEESIGEDANKDESYIGV